MSVIACFRQLGLLSLLAVSIQMMGIAVLLVALSRVPCGLRREAHHRRWICRQSGVSTAPVMWPPHLCASSPECEDAHGVPAVRESCRGIV